MRPFVRLAAVVALAAAVGVVPAGCNGGGQSGRVKVAVVTNCTAEFWSVAEAGANKAAKDFDCDVVFRQPANQTVADQMTIVNDLVAKGVAGLSVSVINPKEQAAALSGVATKLPLIAMDNDAPGSNRRCYIGVDNYESGKAIGRLVKAAVPAGGPVAIFIGSTASANSTARIGGVVDELAGTKDAGRSPGDKLGQYTLHGIFTDDAVETVAQDKAKDVLEKLKGTPNVCCVGLYAYNPQAILVAARSKGVLDKIKIVGFDGDPGTLRGIESGGIVGTVVQDPFAYGYKSVEILAATARGDNSKTVDQAIAHQVVTRDGGPTVTSGGIAVKNLKLADYEAKLTADLASVGAKK